MARPVEFDYLDLLDNHYGHLRKYAPKLLENNVFKASGPSDPLLQALHLLKEMNKSKLNRSTLFHHSPLVGLFFFTSASSMYLRMI
ncbi:hypothetical protein SAMN05444955_108188 [Lihuaxuella thermophila]|uniref:Uncharacterized protein n=1 Tax=Lihuaxuella thermophila TaxID=1173111 RepID=A0A1H8FGX4_9BACL|nr:hypothetical protein SAMN05444955_108188 [Lihuaxuella thermophila]